MALNLNSSLSREYLKPTVDSIVAVQRADGSIPWSQGGITDPWTHVENAMALDVGNFHNEAEHAYNWLSEIQLSDGSWYASYKDGQPLEIHKVSHSVSYIAVGVWHHYLTTGDLYFLQKMWPAVRAAIGFVLDMKGPNGEIYWARDIAGTIYPTALISSCSSTYLSIKSALSMASVLGEDRTDWKEANVALAKSIKEMPCEFGTPQENKFTFAMDWYYPAMCCVINGDEARKRLSGGWDKFVIDGFGCLCSLEQGWVTAAETSELVISLAVHGEYEDSATVFNWIHQLRDNDGAYFYGIALPTKEIWPEEKPTWTSAAVVLAADMLRPMSATSLLLDHHGPATL
ncbi:MAG: phenyltransferase domain-containing protein [Dehalococcoidia bacterium]|nr:phenyltransferase domain-containing protein [Dehalococcoidia bacterium]